MYSFDRKRDYTEYGEVVYQYTTKNEAGQFVYLYFIKEEDKYWWVTFYICIKRKRDFEQLRQTGKDGLKSMLWAKECFKDFINNVCDDNDLIVVYWDDARRRRVYAYGLRDLGFRFGRYNKKEYLMLKVKK